MAVSVRHCAATTAPRNCCPNCYAKQSHKDNARSSAVGKQLKQKKSNSLSLAQHHLPALDLFWASFFLRVQLTPPPLDPAYRSMAVRLPHSLSLRDLCMNLVLSGCTSCRTYHGHGSVGATYTPNLAFRHLPLNSARTGYATVFLSSLFPFVLLNVLRC